MTPPREDDHRLHERGEVGDGVVDLVFVEVGDLLQHRIEGARGLTDADHGTDHGREDLGLSQGFGDRLAFAGLGDRRQPQRQALQAP